jgi:hypothetical protein
VDPDLVERKLAAIMSADVAGYSRLMASDEVATVRALQAAREHIAVFVRQHRGRVVDSPGDNLLAEFPSALDATRCAIEVQRVLRARNADLPPERRLEFRVGLHLGDVMFGPVLMAAAVPVDHRLLLPLARHSQSTMEVLMERSHIEVTLRRFESPDETRVMEKGKFEVVHIGGLAVGRATY